MRMDRLTTSLQNALNEAQSLALGHDHNQIDSVHLLLALLQQTNSTVRNVLRTAGIQVPGFEQALTQIMDDQPKVASPDGSIQIAPELGRLLNLIDKEAQSRGDQFVSSELFLIGALEERSAVGKLMKQQGLNKDVLNKAIDTIRGGEQVNDANAEDNRQSLDKYCIDLTERAEQNKLDPVIGRDDEIRRTIQVLQRLSLIHI